MGKEVGKKKTELSEPGTYTDEPPRLSVCINEVLVGEDRMAPDATVGATFPASAADFFSEKTAGYIGEVISWIVDDCLLKTPNFMVKKSVFDPIWDNAKAARNDITSKYDEDQMAEERWARRVEETFWGVAYGGPNITAAIPKLPIEEEDPYDSDPLAEQSVKPDIASRQVPYIYQRFQPKFLKWSVVNADGWWKGFPADAAKEENWLKNDDPCYSLWMACQFLATYMNLARGLTIEEHMNLAGFVAGQCAHNRVFNTADRAGGIGKWLGTAPKNPDKPYGHVPKALTIEAAYKAAEAEGATFGPGTIVTFNPYGDTKSKEVLVPLSVCKWDDNEGGWVVDYTSKKTRNAAIAVELASAKGVADHNKEVEAAKKRKEELEKSAPVMGIGIYGGLMEQVRQGELQQATAVADQGKQDVTSQGHVMAVPPDPTKKEQVDSGPVVWAKMVFHAQVPGSHIYAGLRNWKKADGTRVLQVLDTNSHPQTNAKRGEKVEDSVASEYLMWKRTSNWGIYCGQYVDGIGGNFVGFGTMPKVDKGKLDEMTAHLARCRPVGFARLVITVPEIENPKYPGIPPTSSDKDILYVRPAAVMWGHSSKANFSMAKYALSLRNTPYYQSLQAYWLIYAPCTELARVMYAPGAREKDLATLIDEATDLRKRINEGVRNPKDRKPYPPKFIEGHSMRLTIILTHDRQGKSRVVWRGNELKGLAGQGMPSKAIKSVFMDASIAYQVPPAPDKMTDLQRVQRDPLVEYIHPSFKKNGITSIEVPDYLSGRKKPDEEPAT